MDKMYHHLATLPHHGRNMRTGIELVDKDGHVIDDYDTIFCELFCVAAAALAHSMHEDLVDAGILWDEILATGGHSHGTTGSISQSSTTYSQSVPSLKQDLENQAEKGMTQSRRNGHGHLMFLVRKVDSSHVDHLAASGYCFADPRQVAHIIGSKMQIRTTRLEQKLRGMERYARGTMLSAGVHLGLFAVRTQVQQLGFDVLVRRQARNLLPSLELPLDRLEPAHTDFLRTLDGMALGAIIKQLERTAEIPARDASFAALLRDAIRNLRASVQDPVFDTARLLSKVSQVPCTPPTKDARPWTCTMISFTIMIPIHVRVDAPAYEFVPLQFFKTQQLVYTNSPHNAAFARSVHRKLSPILDKAASGSRTLPPPSRLRDYLPSFRRPRLLSLYGRAPRNTYTPVTPSQRRTDAKKLVSASREHVALTPCNGSVASLPLYAGADGEVELVSNVLGDRKLASEGSGSDTTKSSTRKQQPSKMSFGGIMISQEVTVDVEEAGSTVPGLPDMPPATQRRESSSTGPGAARQKGQRGLQSSGGEGSQSPPSYDRAIELKEVSTVLGSGMGTSSVEVRKEGDDSVTTFVDDLFSSCLDTPRRM